MMYPNERHEAPLNQVPHSMWTVYTLLLFLLYFLHCLMARNFLAYYTAKPLSFHLNLVRWNQDVRLLLDSLA